MAMNLRQFISCVEKFCPPRLALLGDLVGIQVGPRDPAIQDKTRIRKCAIAVDAGPQVILKAVSGGANILLCYHGILSNPTASITDELFEKARLLIENRLLLYVVHTSWLSAECGVNDTLADVLGLTVTEPLNLEQEGKETPIGRVCNFTGHHEKESRKDGDDVQLSDFIERVVERLRSTDVAYTGSLHASVKKVVVLAGDYGVADLLRLSKNKGVDTCLAGSISRDVATLSIELGMNYVYANQHAIEELGMRRLAQLLGIDAPEIEFLLFKARLRGRLMPTLIP